MIKKDIAICYMVAGLSSRFGGKIKQFANIGPLGETLIEFSINQAINAGFTKIYFIVGNKTEIPFKEKFGNEYKGLPVYYAKQEYDEKTRDKPWGTCDAICSLKNIIDCPFVFCNGDDLYGEDTFKILFNHLTNSNDEATIGFRLFEVLPDIGKHNRALINEKEGYVTNIKEIYGIEKSNLSNTSSKPDDIVSMNIFALHKETLNLLNTNLDKFKERNKLDRTKECLIQEEISNLIISKKIKMRVYNTLEKWLGVTFPEDENILREYLKKK